MLRKKISVVVCAIFLAITCVGLFACGSNDEGGGNQKPLHDATKWFTEEELSAKGLAGLTAPTGLSGKMSSDDAWLNDGYSFSQVCQDEETFEETRKYIFRISKHITPACSVNRESKN